MDSPHLDQSFGIALPLVLYVLYRGVMSVEGFLRGRWKDNAILQATHPVTLVLALAVALIVSGKVEDRVDNVVARFQTSTSEPPAYERVGYSADPLDGAMYRDLKRVVDAYLEPGDRIFDFTNAPALFNYLMEREPSTRYIVVLVAHSEALQEDVVERLRESPPKLIAFDSLINGLTSWDGVPNMARHYAVSQWILDNYRPLLATHQTTFYVRRDQPPLSQVGLDLEEEPVTNGVQFAGQPCTWEYAPNYLRGQSWPGDGTPGPTLGARPAAHSANVIGWAGDPKTEMPAREVILTVGGEVEARVKPTISRPDLATADLPRGFVQSGFQIRKPVEQGREVRVFGVSRSGALTEIVSEGEKPDRGSVVINGRRIDLVPDAVYGQLNVNTSEFVTQIRQPAGSRWSDFRFLEIEAGPDGFSQGDHTIYDRLSSTENREISFQTLDSSPAAIHRPGGQLLPVARLPRRPPLHLQQLSPGRRRREADSLGGLRGRPGDAEEVEADRGPDPRLDHPAQGNAGAVPDREASPRVVAGVCRETGEGEPGRDRKQVRVVKRGDVKTRLRHNLSQSPFRIAPEMAGLAVPRAIKAVQRRHVNHQASARPQKALQIREGAGIVLDVLEDVDQYN